MNELQERLQALVDAGWTKAAIAEAMGVTWPTVWRWINGKMAPAHQKGVLMALDQLARRQPPEPSPPGRRPR